MLTLHAVFACLTTKWNMFVNTITVGPAALTLSFISAKQRTKRQRHEEAMTILNSILGFVYLKYIHDK
jgi:hypothetical protein